MKEERKNAEKRFWRTLFTIAQESGFEPEWEHLGYSCPQRKINELIERFQADPSFPGFYGIRIPLGVISGLQINMIVENQKDLVIGIQTQDGPGAVHHFTVNGLRDLMVSLSGTGRGWDFEAPGWLAWKTPDVHLNFRSLFNRAFLDVILHGAGSDVLALIGGEVTDIFAEVREMVLKEYVGYGALAS
jgi:hypothetical protein